MTMRENFDLSAMDDLSADLDVLKSLLNVAIDCIPSDLGGHAENVLHAALNQLERADDRHRSIHKALLGMHIWKWEAL